MDYPITDPQVLLDKVKEKVSKEMEKSLKEFNKTLNIEDLLKPRRLYLNEYDMIYLKNIIYQRIIQSSIEDYKFGREFFPLKTFNLMLDNSVNILNTIYFHRCEVGCILDEELNFNYNFLPVINECIIEDKWNKGE